jgi:hypothetical protein
VLRAILDVNVWVASFLASARGRDGTSCQMLVESAIAGHCRPGPFVSRISLPMLDTLQAVLQCEFGFPRNLANAAGNVAEAAGSLPPLAVLGGGVPPMQDNEDLGVLETAFAIRADMLVTGNMKDFMAGPKAHIDAEIVRTGMGSRTCCLFDIQECRMALSLRHRIRRRRG